jgi:hypothetical protein
MFVFVVGLVFEGGVGVGGWDGYGEEEEVEG